MRGQKTCTGYPPPPRKTRPDFEVRIAPRPLASGLAPAPTVPGATVSPLIPSLNEPPRATLLSREVTLPPRRAGRRAATSSTSSPVPESLACLPPQSLPLTETEGSYFQIYQEQTANELSGFFDSEFYKERVLEACHSEPAIRHAAIALGALYKTLKQSWTAGGSASNPPREHEEHMRDWQVAIRQYSEACNAMMAMQDPNNNSLRTQLMASVLLASFDSLIGDHKQAIVQIQSGLDLLDRIRNAQRLPAYGVSAGTAEEELTIIFMRLAIQAKSYDLAFHFPEPYVVRFTSPAQHQARLQQLNNEQQHHQNLDPNLYDSHMSLGIETEPRRVNEPRRVTPSGSPSRSLPFSTLREARLAHDRLNERLVRFQEARNVRPKDGSRVPMTEPWGRAIESLREQMVSWARAFEPLLQSRHSAQLTRREKAGIAALKMSNLTTTMVSAIQFSPSESIFDQYLDVFQSIVDLGVEIVQAEEAVGANVCQTESAFCHHARQLPPDYISAGVSSPCHIKPTLSMDTGVVAPLFVTATKCRQPVIRRQAIELLRGCARREGMWDGELTSRIAHWIMRVEEGKPGFDSSYSTSYSDRATSSPYQDLHQEDSTRYLSDFGPHLSSQPYVAAPEERRVALKSADFDLRARWANFTVGTRNIPEDVPDPRYQSIQITW